MAGEVQLYFDGTASAVTAIKAGTAKGMATATDKRVPVLPDLPPSRSKALPELISSAGKASSALAGCTLRSSRRSQPH